MSGIIDTLVTELVYRANTDEIKKAESALAGLEKEQEGIIKQLDELEKEQRAAAAASRELAKQQIDLREKLNATSKTTNDLREAKRQLISEINKETGATEEQKRKLAQIDDELRKTSAQTRGYREELNKLGVDQAKNRLEQSKLSGSSKELQGQSKKVSEGIGKQRDATDKATRSSGGLAAALGKYGPIFAAVAAGLSVVRSAVEGFASLSRMVIETGAKFDGLRARLKTTTGSVASANEAFGMIRQFAKTTPFELEDVTTAFVRLKSLGLAPSTDALKAYGNIAAAQGKPIMDFVEAVADAATGEFERLKEFGIKASSQGDQVAFTFAGVTTRVGKNAREITEFLQQLGATQFSTAMEDQMATFNGQLSNLNDNWSQFLDNVAQQGPMDTAAEGMSLLSGIMTDELAASVAGMVDGAMQKLVDMLAQLDGDSGDLGETISAMIEIFGLIGRVLSPVLDVLATFLHVIMLLVQGVGALAGLLNQLIDALSGLLRPAERLNNLWSQLGSLIGITGEKSKLWFEQEQSLANNLIDTYMGVARARGMITPVGQMTDAELNKKLQEGTLTAEEKAERERRYNMRLAEEQRADAQRAKEKKDEAQAKKIEAAAEGVKDMSDDQLRSFATDPNVPEKQRKKAEQELEKRKEKRSKAGKKASDDEYKRTFAYQIEQQIDDNARKIAQSRAARAFRQGKITSEQMAEFETREFKQVRSATRARYQETGELPAGIAQDVRQISRLPAEADLAGRVAPPVISIQNNVYTITGNEFAVAVEGQFATTPAEVARLSLGEFRRNLNLLLGEATPTPEHR